VWIIYSLLTAFSLATSDALAKKALASRDVYFVAWGRLLFALPVFFATFFFIEIPDLDRVFWIATICALPLEIIAMILYTKALKVSPISLTMPFLALTPLFLIVSAYLILGEKVSFYGAAGIVLMAVGSYTLNFHRIRHDVLEPVKAAFREKGIRMMIVVACIFSITASFGKLAIEHSSPVFFGSFYFILLTIIFTPIAFFRNRSGMTIGKKDVLPLASTGITYSMMIIFHMIAMSMTNVAYMISVKRTSLLFSVLYGYILFKEEKITERTIGATIMLAGFIVLVFSKQG
jgi:uncharacterized membrane protein